MYKIGDYVVYGGEGVCKVLDIGEPAISGVNQKKTYYTLAPVFRGGKIYTPVDTTVVMRPVMTYDEAMALIRKMPEIEGEIYNNSKTTMLSQHYKSYIDTYDCVGLVQVIKSVYLKRQAAIQNKKRLGQVDERYMKRAEDMLYGEFAVVLDIPREEVKGFIEREVEKLGLEETADGEAV